MKLKCTWCFQALTEDTAQACTLQSCDPKTDLFCGSDCGHDSCDEQDQPCIEIHQDTRHS